MPAPRPRRADYVAFRQLQTRWMDNDIYGHMNNVVHYSLFDTAVNGWLMDQGLLDPKTSDSYGLVVETGCKYFAEMQFPDLVHAGLRIARIGGSSVRFEIALFRNEDDEAAAEGFFVHVYVGRDTHRPVPIDGARRAAFQTLLVEA
ncbi:Putative thioesterase [Pseudooceanicola batsensis HTCC2597]|uniref:Putative thioesterase n=1 Tax=Pseudooceanicola batsensis (strain ATCC BAA-863 / DSM 15984 / KCTC 12145 / HTCC2597) TaxID=252305 RepID=A3U0A5_PSEBH|nr:thioesterase family protein [Pseudooceanicola batsensis]EAQ02196.1 Putative thioesterase [Pseudooceanicola batsensis HTCC2597]